MGNKQGVKRTLVAPSNARPVGGELLSGEALEDDEVQWIWCHHGERGIRVASLMPSSSRTSVVFAELK
jgi:hypothetical protein